MKKPLRRASKGLTLLEVAISMALFGIISVAVASMLTSGIDTQMSYRVHEYEHNIALNIIDRMRMDLLMARNVTVGGGGTTVTFTTFDPNTGVDTPVTWVINGGVATRNGMVMSTSPSPNIQLLVTCGGNTSPSCFEGWTPAAGQPIKRVILHELTVTQNIPMGGGTAIDRNFGPARYRVNEFSFDVMPGTRFQ